MQVQVKIDGRPATIEIEDVRPIVKLIEQTMNEALARAFREVQGNAAELPTSLRKPS